MKLGRRTAALERTKAEVADKAQQLLRQIAEREVHIAKVREAEILANEERVLKAALHQADKEATIIKAARANEYARLRQLAKVMTDEERLVMEATSKDVVWKERQDAQRRFIIARDLGTAAIKKVGTKDEDNN